MVEVGFRYIVFVVMPGDVVHLAGTADTRGIVPAVFRIAVLSTSSDVARGLLIYPAHEVSVRDEVDIRNTSVSFRQTTIDLGGSGEQLRQACDDLAGEVFG
jgi:hypothetical protein